MKPGAKTSEFYVILGTITSILSGAVSSEHQQVILSVLAAAYTFGRVVVKAVHAWKTA